MGIIHVFLLMVYLGDKVVSKDMYFRDIDRCLYFAHRLNEQVPVPDNDGKKLQYTAVCVPKAVGANTRVY